MAETFYTWGLVTAWLNQEEFQYGQAADDRCPAGYCKVGSHVGDGNPIQNIVPDWMRVRECSVGHAVNPALGAREQHDRQGWRECRKCRSIFLPLLLTVPNYTL